jgi:hypothetical protein
MTAGRHVNPLSQTWCTPPKYVNAIKRFWNGKIDLDPCSNEYSVVNAEVEYRLPEHDGLKESWNYPTVYVNPPYGADRERGTTIKDWLAKCVNTHRSCGSEVIALVPVATNTSHWKKFVFGVADAVCFLYDTRLRFLENGIDTGKGAPMACCLIYWGDNVKGFRENFMQYGAVADIRDLKEVPIGADVFVQELEFA